MKKKILLSLGTVAMVATPIAAVVSCGTGDSEKKKLFEKYVTNTISTKGDAGLKTLKKDGTPTAADLGLKDLQNGHGVVWTFKVAKDYDTTSKSVDVEVQGVFTTKNKMLGTELADEKEINSDAKKKAAIDAIKTQLTIAKAAGTKAATHLKVTFTDTDKKAQEVEVKAAWATDKATTIGDATKAAAIFDAIKGKANFEKGKVETFTKTITVYASDATKATTATTEFDKVIDFTSATTAASLEATDWEEEKDVTSAVKNDAAFKALGSKAEIKEAIVTSKLAGKKAKVIVFIVHGGIVTHKEIEITFA